MPKTMAPVLTWLTRHDWTTWNNGYPPGFENEGDIWAAAAAEVKAFEAVARAADRDLFHSCGGVDEVLSLPDTFKPYTFAVARALARLARLSTPRKPKGGKP